MHLLVALPFELLAEIARYTAAEDRRAVLNLRRTSRKWQRCAEDAFLDTFFTARCHLYIDHSLRVLYEISTSRRLRSRLSQLTLHFPPAYLTDLEGHARRCHPFGALCDSTSSTHALSNGTCLIRDWETRTQDAEEEFSVILEAALAQFRLGGVIPSIVTAGYRDYRDQGVVPYGLRTAKRSLRRMTDYQSSFRNSSDSSAVLRILVAIVRSEFPVKDLDIRALHMDPPCQPWAFENMVPASGSTRANLVKLTTTIDKRNLEYDFCKGARAPFQQWLKSLRSLEHLDIGFEWPSYGPNDYMLAPDKWRDLTECLGYAPLSTLTLSTGRFAKQGVIYLLKSLRTRLQSLSFSDIKLVDITTPESFPWPALFAWIATNLELKHVGFEGISHDHSQLATLDETSRYNSTGDSDTVRRSLNEFILTARFPRNAYDHYAEVRSHARARIDGQHKGDSPAQQMTGNDNDDDYGPSFNDSELQTLDDLATQFHEHV